MIKKIKSALIIVSIILLAGCASNARVVSQTPPQNVALLLPLSGPLAPYGTAIRNGFFSAYYAQRKTSGYAPKISVYDTDSQPIQTLYQTAVAQGANFIVGPLDKNQMIQLSKTHLSTPTLALNSSPEISDVDNLYTFALSPTTEATQVAEKAQRDQRHAILIIAPDSALGTRMVSAFSSTWKKMNGRIAGVTYYSSITTLSRNISSILGISEDRQTALSLEKTLHQQVRYTAERRQDFDSIFIIADAKMAKQIMLLLQFYFATNVPIYATSLVYNDVPDVDLDGIQFCGLPWLIAPQALPPAMQSLQQQIQMMWPKDHYQRFAEFYGMGVDAFMLVSNSPQMIGNSSLQIPGATGWLSVGPNHDIQRQLLWAQFKNGQPVPLQP